MLVLCIADNLRFAHASDGADCYHSLAFATRPVILPKLPRVAVLTNIHSSFNRRHLNDVRAKLGGDRVRHLQCEDLDQMRACVPELDASNCDVLAINGGDGTVHLTLTAMIGLGITPPVLALLPGGTTNMTAHDINGRRMRFDAALNRFLDAAAAGTPPAPKPVVQVRDNDRIQLGFAFGMGAIIRGIQYCHEQVYSAGIGDEWASGVAVARAAWGIVRRDPVFADGVPLSLDVDGRRSTSLASIFLVSTLARLLMGIHPFWGTGRGALSTTLVEENARHFLRAFPALLRGRPNSHLTEAGGYTSWQADRVEVAGRGQYTIDGEIYETNGLTVTANHDHHFLQLGARP